MIPDLLNETCKIPSDLTTSWDGKESYTTVNPYPCRAKEKYQLVKNNAGENVVSNIEFWLSPNAPVKLDLPIFYGVNENNNDIKHYVISIQPKKNTLGEVIYKKVFV